MACALTVLFGTLFANLAGLPRLWLDVLGIWRAVDPANPRHRRRALAAFSWALPVIWTAVYLAVPRPLYLVVFMGISNALFLLVVAYQALVFRYRHTDPRLAPSPAFDACLWLSILLIGFAGAKVGLSAFR
jgi:hypothetical protein